MKRKLQKLILSLLLVFMLITWALPCLIVFARTGNGDIIVHITRTGVCYHKAGCGALRSDIEIALEDAYVRGYLPCKRCHPPEYTGSATRNGTKHRGTAGDGAGEGPNITMLVVLGGLVIVITIGIIVSKIKAAKKAKIDKIQREIEEENRRKLEEENEKKKRLQRQHEYAEKVSFYEKNYKGKSISVIVNAPEDVSITREGHVSKGVVTEMHPFGELTVFISASGRKYHQNSFCHGVNKMLPINQYDAMSKGYYACSYCIGKSGNIPEWYWKITPTIKKINELERILEKGNKEVL